MSLGNREGMRRAKTSKPEDLLASDLVLCAASHSGIECEMLRRGTCGRRMPALFGAYVKVALGAAFFVLRRKLQTSANGVRQYFTKEWFFVKRLLSILLMIVLLVGTIPAMAETTDGSVDLLRIGTTRSLDGSYTVMTEGGAFGKINYNATVLAPFTVVDSHGVVQPFFMTSWELSDDLNTMTATFATDQGITWHDGEPVTMDDVLFTFNYMISRSSGYMPGLVSVEKVDDVTAILHFKDGKAFSALNAMASFTEVKPEHIWSKVEGEYSEYQGEDARIGCGPYRLADVDEDAQILTYEAVCDAYLGRPVTVRAFTVKCYDSADALVMALRSGEVDAMYNYSNSLDPTMAASVTGVENLDPGMSDNTGNYQIVFGFNKQPTDDLAFRKAVRAALDYELLRSSVGGENGEIPGTRFPEQLDSIGFTAFFKTAFVNLVLPDRLRVIGDWAFASGTALKSVRTGKGTKIISLLAFNNNPALSQITLNEGLDSIGDQAFTNLPALDSIVIPSTVRAYGKEPFALNEKLFNITVLNPTPVVLTQELVAAEAYEAITLHVPAGSVDAYKAADIWKKFGDIQGDASGVGSIDADGAEPYVTATFTIDGKPASANAKGLLIQRLSDGSCRKVMIR